MTNEDRIWQFLWEHIGNGYGVAGLMGNLAAESGLRPDNLENSYERSLGMTDAEYAAAVDSGAYNLFCDDRAGWGLAQWTYPTRKRALLDYAKERGTSIADLDMQLNFLWHELGQYKKVLETLLTAQTVRAASDAVLLYYEKPSNLSETNCQNRAKIGEGYYRKHMTEKRKLTVYKRLFYQSDCYNAGTRITPAGVQVHSTGAANSYLKRYVQPDDGRLGLNPNGNSHNRPGGNVCASAYIGKLADGTVAVYQALPWDYRCWLSGSGSKGNANTLGYLGFEVCEDTLTDEAYFTEAVMGKAVLLAAHWCILFGLDVDAVVRDHSELHSMGLASNHSDITAWLKRFGKTMDDFRAAVKAAVSDGVEVTYIDCDEVIPLYYARAINPGRYLNIRSGPGQAYKTIGQIPQGETVSVIDDSVQDWSYVKYQDVTGYAMSEYLERVQDDPEAGQTDEPASDIVEITIRVTRQDMQTALDSGRLVIDCRSGNVANIDYQ